MVVLRGGVNVDKHRCWRMPAGSRATRARHVNQVLSMHCQARAMQAGTR